MSGRRMRGREQQQRRLAEATERHRDVDGLADRLAALVAARDDDAALLDARCDAWRTAPTLRRTGSSGSAAGIPARWLCRSC